MRMHAMADPASVQRNRHPWWNWLIGGLVVLVILSVIFGDGDDPSRQATTTVTVTQPEQPVKTQTIPAKNPALISDARKAVAADEYAKAVAIAAALGREEEQLIRRQIANRIARLASAAVRAGDRRQAKTLLARADRFPTTTLTRQARSSYRAAKAQAAEDAHARRLAAEQRRQAIAQRRRDQQAAEQTQPESAGNCDRNYSGCVAPYPPDVNCPQVNGPVQVLGDDPHGLDRDGDGIACE
jgi:multidrug efflux pump subunit AcrA (membrane-fusion protein)